jgi:phospholipid transport system substrate-binding protein
MSDSIRRRGSLRSRCALLPLAAILLAAPGFADGIEPGAEEAVVAVRETLDEVLAVLASEGRTREQRIEALEKIAYARFDFSTISRLVLARSYKKFSPDQLDVFEVEFKDFLSRSYGTRLNRYEQERVDLNGARVEKRGDVTVMTRIVGGSADGIDMSYRLRNGKGEHQGQWRMIDVVIEGVSLVSTFRSQFKELMGKGGPDYLLEQLKSKNLDGEVPALD